RLPRARERAVEVDEVERLRPVALERERRLDRIAVVARLAVRRALDEPDGPPAAQVDRRNHSHGAAILAKFSSSRRPARWLFSGWNCAPKSRPRPHTDGNTTPSYSVVASTSSSRRASTRYECTK